MNTDAVEWPVKCQEHRASEVGVGISEAVLIAPLGKPWTQDGELNPSTGWSLQPGGTRPNHDLGGHEQ